jgi:hypothetical protein
VCAEEQAVSEFALAAREQEIRAECERRGLVLLALHTDAGISGKSFDQAGLTAAVKCGEGARLGRQSVVPEDVVARILDRHGAGASHSAIARQLNDDGVATTHGGPRLVPEHGPQPCSGSHRGCLISADELKEARITR